MWNGFCLLDINFQLVWLACAIKLNWQSSEYFVEKVIFALNEFQFISIGTEKIEETESEYLEVEKWLDSSKLDSKWISICKNAVSYGKQWKLIAHQLRKTSSDFVFLMKNLFFYEKRLLWL